jgi:flagellar biosynthesis activator protein FlaF
MQISRYSETLSEDPGLQRAREREAFEQSVVMLEAAERAGAGSQDARDAAAYLNRLWGFLIEDLGRPENDLPAELRANLMSLGLWTMRELMRMDRAESANFGLLKHVSRSMAAGLA